MRCVAMADALRTQGAEVTFACAALPGNLNDWLEKQGYPVLALEAEESELPLQASDRFDWLVVDHYHLDALWEVSARMHVHQILVIDDLADRHHACDILLDQNYVVDLPGRYAGLVPAGSQLLLGPRYALLRPEFSERHAQAGQRQFEPVRRILVFFGGTDPTGETLKALDALDILDLPDVTVDVVVGNGNPHREVIEARCQERENTNFYCQVNTMADLLLQADLAIGAGGTTTWERLCLGLPAVVTAIASNQTQISRDVAGAGCQVFLGSESYVTAEILAGAVRELCQDGARRQAMSRQGLEMVDGEGLQRVCDTMRQLTRPSR